MGISFPFFICREGGPFGKKRDREFFQTRPAGDKSEVMKRTTTMEQKAQSCIDLLVVAGHLVIIVALAASALLGRRATDDRRMPSAPSMSILETYQVDDEGMPRK
jgi:hypothetical protein